MNKIFRLPLIFNSITASIIVKPSDMTVAKNNGRASFMDFPMPTNGTNNDTSSFNELF